MTLTNGRDLIPPLFDSELEALDPLVRWQQRKQELRGEEQRRERRERPKLDVRPLTMAEVAADQEAQDVAIGRAIGNARRELEREIARLREQVAELSKELAELRGFANAMRGGGAQKRSRSPRRSAGSFGRLARRHRPAGRLPQRADRAGNNVH